MSIDNILHVLKLCIIGIYNSVFMLKCRIQIVKNKNVTEKVVKNCFS